MKTHNKELVTRARTLLAAPADPGKNFNARATNQLLELLPELLDRFEALLSRADSARLLLENDTSSPVGAASPPA